MQESAFSAQLQADDWDTAIVGKVVDERGEAAVAFVRAKAARVLVVDYDPDAFSVSVDGVVCEVDDLTPVFGSLGDEKIVLEATTLGFVEILLCCRALQGMGSGQLDITYVEPVGYNSPQRSNLLHKRDFDLSDEVSGYKAIPGATMMLSDRKPQHGVFFLGYEERRLDRALEDHQMISPSNCSVVFGVPAFTPGWEMDAFANNIRVLSDKNVRGGVHFCGAENPAATIDVLDEIYLGLRPQERLFVVPIGTKPSGIGVALFVATHPDVGVLYDHPKRRAGRTSKVGRWHMFRVHLDD